MDLVTELSSLVPRERLHTDGEGVERPAGGFFGYHASHRPDAVVFPKSIPVDPEDGGTLSEPRR